jgi:hypothetical protein
MRKVVAALMFMIAGAFILLTAMTLSNLWDTYQDSPDWLYISAAAIEGVGVLAACLVGGLLLRGR